MMEARCDVTLSSIIAEYTHYTLLTQYSEAKRARNQEHLSVSLIILCTFVNVIYTTKATNSP